MNNITDKHNNLENNKSAIIIVYGAVAMLGTFWGLLLGWMIWG